MFLALLRFCSRLIQNVFLKIIWQLKKNAKKYLFLWIFPFLAFPIDLTRFSKDYSVCRVDIYVCIFLYKYILFLFLLYTKIHNRIKGQINCLYRHTKSHICHDVARDEGRLKGGRRRGGSPKRENQRAQNISESLHIYT